MSEDPITVTTRTSWFSRLGSALGGVLTGLALIVAAIALLSWNEGRSVKATRTNAEGAGAVTAIAADSVSPANEGRLVHLSAPAVTDGQRRDTATGIAADGLVLTRKVEYFQWVETSRSETRARLGGGEETVTTYSYDRQWTSTPQDSSGFQQPAGHQNPVPTIKDATFRAETARLGAFSVDRAVLDQLSADTPLTLSAEHANAVRAALSRPVRIEGPGLFVGVNPANPVPGDIRVTYQVAPQNQILSVVGAQSGQTLRPYAARTGSGILMVRTGSVPAEQMFAQAQAGNQMLSWGLRALGVVVLIAAVGMVLGPLGVLADVVPLFGSIVRMGTGLVAGVTGLTIGAVVIALAWIAHRPLIGVGLLAVAGGLTALLIWRAKQKKTA